MSAEDIWCDSGYYYHSVVKLYRTDGVVNIIIVVTLSFKYSITSITGYIYKKTWMWVRTLRRSEKAGKCSTSQMFDSDPGHLQSMEQSLVQSVIKTVQDDRLNLGVEAGGQTSMIL